MHHGAENDAVVSSRIDATDSGFINTHSFSEGPGFRLDWYRPNRTTLHFGPTDESKLNIFSVPISDELTRVMTCRELPEGAELSEWRKAHEAAGNPVLGEDRISLKHKLARSALMAVRCRYPPMDPPSRFVDGIGRRFSTRPRN